MGTAVTFIHLHPHEPTQYQATNQEWGLRYLWGCTTRAGNGPLLVGAHPRHAQELRQVRLRQFWLCSDGGAAGYATAIQLLGQPLPGPTPWRRLIMSGPV